MKLPNWVWTIIWIVVVLIVLALLKVNIQLGAGGISISQGLIN